MITQPGQPAPQLDVDAYVRGEAAPRRLSVGAHCHPSGLSG